MHGIGVYRTGVGLVLRNSEGLVFAGRRKDGRESPWQMPQGGLQPGEKPPQAVMREAKEELGTAKMHIVGCIPRLLRYDYPVAFASKRASSFRGQEHYWFLLQFDGTGSDIELRGPHAEFDRWQWLTPATIIERAVAFKRPIYRMVMSAFFAHQDVGATAVHNALPDSEILPTQ
jgi:putative (di)nucleoside polyphosphate hydrolase